METWKRGGMIFIPSLAIFIVALCLVSFYWNNTSSAYVSNLSDSEPLPEKITAVVDGDELTDSIITTPKKEIDTARNNGEYRAIAIGEYQTAIEKIFSLSNNINKEAAQKEILKDLSENPQIIDIAENIAGNYQAANELYGDKQAEARVASIMLLEHLAREGNFEPIEIALSNTSVKMQNEVWEKGIEHDYSDLVTGYVSANAEIFGDDNMVANFGAILDATKMSKKLEKPFMIGLGTSGITMKLPYEKLKVIGDKMKERTLGQ